MFISRREFESLKSDVRELEKPEPIGEVYKKCYSNYGCISYMVWEPFYQSSVCDTTETEIKIFGQWHKLKDCIFYAHYSPWNKDKAKIEASHKETKCH
jgi:hypothetical protein